MSQPPYGQQPDFGQQPQPYQQSWGQPQPAPPKNNTTKILLLILIPVAILGLLCVGLMVALLLPAMTRKAASTARASNNMREVMLSLHNFESAYKTFPYTEKQLDANGKPLLSWRVHILPFLERNDLYEQFHLDEPWDSPHNKTLIARMPDVFQIPGDETADGRTMIRAISGDHAMMPFGPGVGFRDISDGSSNTVFIVVADSQAAVPWTSPEPFNNQVSSLKVFSKDEVMVGFADGAVARYPVENAKAVWKSVIGRDDGIAQSLQ